MHLHNSGLTGWLQVAADRRKAGAMRRGDYNPGRTDRT